MNGETGHHWSVLDADRGIAEVGRHRTLRSDHHWSDHPNVRAGPGGVHLIHCGCCPNAWERPHWMKADRLPRIDRLRFSEVYGHCRLVCRPRDDLFVHRNECLCILRNRSFHHHHHFFLLICHHHFYAHLLRRDVIRYQQGAYSNAIHVRFQGEFPFV